MEVADPAGDAFFTELRQESGIAADAVPLPEVEVARTLADAYGLTGPLTRIDTEKDDTFSLESERGRLLVKVAPAEEASEVVDLQSAAIAHVRARDPELPIQRLVSSVDGRIAVTVSDPSGRPRVLRVLTFIEGSLLHDAAATTDELVRTGAMLARLDVALADFAHPSDERLLLWDLKHFAKLRNLVSHVEDRDDRALAYRVFDAFEAEVVPRMADLETQVIHGDFSPFNVVVEPGASGFVKGVIDFGDVVRSPLIFELSVAAANQLGAGAGDPWAGAAAIIRGYRTVRPMEPQVTELLATTAPARLLLRALIYGWRAEREPQLRRYALAHSAPDWQRLRRALAADPATVRATLAATDPAIHAPREGADVTPLRTPTPRSAQRPTMVNAFDEAGLEDLPQRMQDQMAQRAGLLGPGYRLFYEEPVEIVRGSGSLLYDADGVDYLDAYNNVASVGHANPRVVEAVHRQLQTLNTNTRYLQQSILDYSAQLLATMPDELSHVMYTCTGSEANDLALRVASYATRRQGVIVTANAYHGLTAAVSSFSPSLGGAVPLAPWVRTIDAPDALRTAGKVGESMRIQVRAAIDDLERHGYELAIFIADTIFSSDGIFADPAGFLAPVLEEVHAAGGLFVADEVQPGFGRLGESWWGFQRHGLVPDIVTMGKPMGNGTPVAAAVFRPELLAEFGRDVRYFNTYGGNSVSVAAAQAVLDVIEDDGLIAHSRRVGQLLTREIENLAKGYQQVAEVRGAGLFIGVDLVTDQDSKTPDSAASLRVVNEMRRRRVLISASGPTGHTLKIRPPLVFSEGDAERLVERLSESFAAVLL